MDGRGLRGDLPRLPARRLPPPPKETKIRRKGAKWESKVEVSRRHSNTSPTPRAIFIEHPHTMAATRSRQLLLDVYSTFLQADKVSTGCSVMILHHS